MFGFDDWHFKETDTQPFYGEVERDPQLENPRLPPLFADGVMIYHLSQEQSVGHQGSYYGPKLEIPAKCLYPNKAIVEKAVHSCDIKNELKENLIQFAERQEEIIELMRTSETECLSEKLFRFFAASLQIDMLLGYKKYGSFEDGKVFRSHHLKWINLFPYYTVWKLCCSEEQKQCFEESIQNIFRLLRPTEKLYLEDNLYKNDQEESVLYCSFLSEMGVFIDKAVLETNVITQKFLPRSKMTNITKNNVDEVPFTALREHYLSMLSVELNQIVNSGNEEIRNIFEKMTLKTPYCGVIKVTEFFCSGLYSSDRYNRFAELDKIFLQSFQIHSVPFLLTYYSNQSYEHHWGHKSPKTPKVTDFSKKVIAGKPRKKIEALEKLKNSSEDEVLVNLITNLIEKKGILHEVGRTEYQLCKGLCTRDIICLNPQNVFAIPEASELNWDHFDETAQQIVIQAWRVIYQQLEKPDFAKTFQKFIVNINSSKHSRCTLSYDISSRDEFNLFFPVLFEALQEGVETTGDLIPYCFVIDRFLKIFDISCRDKSLELLAIKDEEKKLGKLIAHLAPQDSLQHAYRPTPHLEVNTDFIYRIKKAEVLKYFTELDASGSEPNLSFEPKEALILHVPRMKSEIYLESVKMVSHSHGLSYFRREEDNEIVKFFDKRKQKLTSISPVIKEISSYWEKGVMIIPIIQKSLLQNTTDLELKKSKKTDHDKFIERDNSQSIKLRRRSLLANDKAVSHYVESRVESQRNYKLSEKKRARQENDDQDCLLSMLALPNFLMNWQLTDFGDLFCNVAKEMMISAWRDDESDRINFLMNSSAMELLDPPLDNLNVEERHQKTALIDSLRGYQKTAIARFEAWKEAGVGGIIADEPGLGKTIQGCEILLRSLLENPGQPGLVICPKLVKN